MTQFGSHSESTSPARKRIEERAYELRTSRIEAKRLAAQEAERRIAAAAAEQARRRDAVLRAMNRAALLAAAERRRKALTGRFERAFEMTKGRVSTMREIVAETARKHGVTVNEIMSDSRRMCIVMPRREAMWLCHALTSNSVSAIARFFSRDPTTVLHAIDKYEEHLAEVRAALDMEGA